MGMSISKTVFNRKGDSKHVWNYREDIQRKNIECPKGNW